MDSTLVEMFRHNHWANLQLLEACAALEPMQLNAAADGSFGSIRDTLVHLLAAEERYVALLSGEAAQQQPLRESAPFPGFERLRLRAQRSGEALIAIAGDDPAAEVLEGTRGGEPYALPAVLPLVQAIHHANEHRAQITSVMGRLGIEPPDLSAWRFFANA